MKKSEKMKRELHNFWLKQLDQNKGNDTHGRNDQQSRQSLSLASDSFYQRQLQRLTSQTGGKPAVNGSSIQSPRIAVVEKHIDARPMAAAKFVESNQANATDRLRQWLSQNVAAEQFEGQFYVKAVDLLSLERAKQDWNSSTGNAYAGSCSRPGWLAIDDRLMWLSAPCS